MNHSFEVDGVAYQLSLSRCQQDYRLCLSNEVIAPIALSQQSEGCGVLTIAGESEPVRFAIDGDVIHVHIRGRTRILHYRDALRTLACANNKQRHRMARAPMPGLVVTTSVSPGQAVSVGTPLMIIESMKLETIIRSPGDGVIDRIHFNEGESFEQDAVLVTLCEQGR
ncbi:acetyl-CoA carboxylase biotin carboxyl carrier protein subunit [Bradyrhizobium murdochi]|uniref:acetyl-CoA carboxylase biotin carboxyl carrier protein subunit n=1 Tax=Bradyrhizobium murdochi TaxID=1038859 RepID=UPI0018DDEBD9|nr:acetyl-CoA carboxylase biotin carboxyl carrier protein subunit [Bradyrhizobium murdochi]